MTAKNATLLTVLMVSAIVFMAVGIFTVDAGNQTAPHRWLRYFQRTLKRVSI
ncbi:hypothetical protein VXQ18_02735 [Brucella abortus]|nr:hypothetical protein [Brucella abortus]